jgi:hypothetical protein
MRIRARHYSTGQIIDLDCAAGRIRAAREPGPTPPDLEAGWVAPGLFDLRVNGCGGKNFSSPNLTPSDVAGVVRARPSPGPCRASIRVGIMGRDLPPYFKCLALFLRWTPLFGQKTSDPSLYPVRPS